MRWIWVLSIVGCAAEERSKPEPPDMSALIAAYATPTATFDGQGATEVRQLVESKVRTLLDFDVIVDRLQQTIAALGEDAGAAFAPGRPLALEGEGVATVQRICSGFGDPVPPVDKDANGFLSLTAGYSDNGLDPVVFGGATACQEQVSGVQMQVAGDVHLYVGEGTGVTDLASTTFLFELANFAFEVDGTTEISGGFDFEASAATAVEPMTTRAATVGDSSADSSTRAQPSDEPSATTRLVPPIHSSVLWSGSATRAKAPRATSVAVSWTRAIA